MEKKVIILSVFLIIIFTFLGCVGNSSDKGGDEQVEFITGIYHNKKWDESIGTYKQDVIPDQEVALNVASQIFKGMQKSEEIQKYVCTSVFYDEQDEIWIVSFGRQSDEMIVGGECNIAICKNDGKILRIWYDE